MALPKWLQLLATLGPEILAFTPLAPIAGPVVAGIAAAKAMDGASNHEKLQSVVLIAGDAAAAVNAKAGKQVVDPSAVAAVAAQAISTVVDAVNVAHTGTSALPPTPPAVAQSV